MEWIQLFQDRVQGKDTVNTVDCVKCFINRVSRSAGGLFEVLKKDNKHGDT
jgi:hypothetical protein